MLNSGNGTGGLAKSLNSNFKLQVMVVQLDTWNHQRSTWPQETQAKPGPCFQIVWEAPCFHIVWEADVG